MTGATETRARLRRCKGRTYLDVRLYAQTDSGETVPTRKGVCLAVEHLDALADAVAIARGMVEKEAGHVAHDEA